MTVAALAFALAVAWLAAAATPAHAAFPGANGVIAYQSTDSARGVLLARAATGGALRRFVVTGAAVSDPTFSPRGRRLAFARVGAIWVMQLDGTGLRRVTAQPLPESEPAWSPAGEALAFAAGRARSQHFYTVGGDGTGLRQITFAPGDQRSPAWSSRGTIAFAQRSSRGDYDVYTVTSIGTGLRRLTGTRQDELWPNWSPDGRHIAFVGGRRQVYVMGSNGRHVRRLTKLKGGVESPVWSPDGKRIAFVAGGSHQRRLMVMSSKGRGLKRLTAARSDAHAPDWQPAGLDPVVAAAGDIACDPANRSFNGGLGTRTACAQLATSNLLLRRDLDAVLPLGDNQYEDGMLAKYQASFDPTWGRLRSLMHPVPGNHEYGDPGAAGYWDYFNGVGQPTGVAGDRSLGYYSFDIGTWHVVAINSECSDAPSRAALAPSCAPGSPQEQWLRADLAAHRNLCTLAIWHHPAFTSGLEGPSPVMDSMWQALYDNGADVVLNGHAHLYERFAPQTPQGIPDPVRGIREFVVGTGGKNHQGLRVIAANSEVRNTSAYGILQLTLHPRSYDWRFASVPGSAFTDAGSGACH
jgi:acid phosphatase type 7